MGKLPQDDPRYLKWRRSLSKRPAPWNKGCTKDDHSGVNKISETFKRKKIDNFAEWRRDARENGSVPNGYPPFRKDEKLAFLIVIFLGDGHLYGHERTDSLMITLGPTSPIFGNIRQKLSRTSFEKILTSTNRRPVNR